jgi:hypothetical protein
MGTWYHDHLVATGRSATVWLLIGFLVAYVLTRLVTRRIHARRQREQATPDGPIKDIYIGGVHIHHQVWGMLLVLVAGLVGFRFRPESPWQDVLAVLFGVGAALVLDEFALWIHLEDVYWTDEGRKSIDAVMVALVVGLALLATTSPVGLDPQTARNFGYDTASLAVVVCIGFTVICLLKGKIATGLVGLPLPFIGLIGAIRLAKPTSYWARRFYGANKMDKAQARFGARHQARHERLRDLFSFER